MAAFASSVDVADRWRALTQDEQRVANTLCEDASDMIMTRWSDVDERIAAGTLAVSSLVRVVANMVKRAMIVGDKEGIETHSEGAGPFNYADKYANPNANLYFTTEDIRLLEGRVARRAFAVDLSDNVPPCGYGGTY